MALQHWPIAITAESTQRLMRYVDGEWSAFDPAPANVPDNAVWGTPDGKIMLRVQAVQCRFELYDPSDNTWTVIDAPAAYNSKCDQQIHGVNGYYVAVGSGGIAYYDADDGAWTGVDLPVAGFSPISVWVAGRGDFWVGASDVDEGAYHYVNGGWSDELTAVMVTDGAVTDSDWVYSIWGTGSRSVYFGLGNGSAGHMVAYGGQFTLAGTLPGTYVRPRSIWHDGSTLYVLGVGAYNRDAKIYSGSGTELYDPGVDLSPVGVGRRQIVGHGNTVYFVAGTSGYGDSAFLFFGRIGGTWQALSTAGWPTGSTDHCQTLAIQHQAPPAVALDTRTGRHFNLYCKIDGIEPIYWRYSHHGTPTQDWSRSIETRLLKVTEHSDSLDLATMRAGMDAMTFWLRGPLNDDGTDPLGQQFAPAKWYDGDFDYLADGSAPNDVLSANATSIDVKSEAPFTAPLNVHIGQELVQVGRTDTGQLTECERGCFPCVGDFWAGTYATPEENTAGHTQTVATDPYTMVGRRIALYATAWDDEAEDWCPESGSA